MIEFLGMFIVGMLIFAMLMPVMDKGS